jgi:type III secretion system YscQ/HrcQ family protein
MNSAPGWSEANYDSLPTLTCDQMDTWNRLQKVFGGEGTWRTWIAESLADFFERPGEPRIRLQQKHSLDPGHVDCAFDDNAREILFGRDRSCAIQLTPRSVGSRHARISKQDGRYYVEDLNSALGTFLNDVKLKEGEPKPIVDGDQIAIFPYTFTVSITETWLRETSFEVHVEAPSTITGEDFAKPSRSDGIRASLRIYPANVELVVETSRQFVARLTGRMLFPFCPDTKQRLGLTEFDSGLLELLSAALAERMNQDLPFPLHVEVFTEGARCWKPESQQGVGMGVGVRIGDLAGRLRLLIPDASLTKLSAGLDQRKKFDYPDLSWGFLFSAGRTELTVEEIASIETADVVLLESEPAILFPSVSEKGWLLKQNEGNLSESVIDKYFERFRLNETENAVHPASSTPDLASLPIILHAIIGEKTMTLGETDALIPGAIIRLEEAKSDPVRIALNGKIAGTGQLVEIDGRLGVRVLSWRTP